MERDMPTDIRERAPGPAGAACRAPRHHPMGSPIQARQVLYARQQVHIRLGSVLGRAGFGAIQGIE